MKVVSFLLLALLPASLATNLRHEHGREQRRRLNAATINAAIEATLPTINSLIQAQIPDPIAIGQTATASGVLSTGDCSGDTATGTVTIDEISGTSTTEITSLTVQEDTSTYDCGCPSTFTGTFDFLTSAESYSVTGDTVFTNDMSVTTNTCSYSPAVTGTVTKPAFAGEVYLEGEINGNAVTITTAEVKSITATCESTATTYVPTITGTDYESIAAAYTSALGTEYKNYVSNTLTTVITDAINTGIQNSVTNLGIGGGAPYILGFYRAAAEDRITNLRTNAENQITNLEARANQIRTDVETRAETAIANWSQRGQEFAGRLNINIGDGAV